MLAEASAGTCDFIKSLAEEMAPEIAGHYLLDYPDAAVGIATDRLREEFGAPAFKLTPGDRVTHIKTQSLRGAPTTHLIPLNPT